MSVMVGVGKAAEAGVLIRNGEALQSASKITAMVLDKTGTITAGAPSITDIIITDKAYSEKELLTLAASIESGSEHPLAEAIVDSALEQGIALESVSDFHAITGQGVQANIKGQQLLFGNQKLMLSNKVALNDSVAKAQKLADEAKTPMYLAIDNKLAAIIAVSDPIKELSLIHISEPTRPY